MKLTNKTTTDIHLLKLEQYATKINKLIAATIINLNDSYNYLWGLPDDELQSVLQELLNSGNLQPLFENHYISAISLNKIQDNTGAGGVRAIAVAGREFEIDEFGTVSVIPLSEPEIVEPPSEIIAEELI